MAPLHVRVEYVCLVFISWSLVLVIGSPIHPTRDDQTLPRDTEHDHATPSLDTYTPALSIDTQKRGETSYNGIDVVSISENQCRKDTDCYPKEYKNYTIPSEFVHCEKNSCQCQDCFYNLNDSCAITDCHHFSNRSGKCVDDRKSQFDAFLLSIFLSATGAANLYIGQDTLGKAV